MLQVTGILKQKFSEQQVTEKFRKREFLLTVEPNSPYPQVILFQLGQDKCSLIDGFQLGEEVVVSFNLKGREWKAPDGSLKYFTSLDVWKVTKASNQSSVANDTEFPLPSLADMPQEDYKDDLPF